MTDAVRSWARSSFSTRAAISLLDSISSRMRTKVRTMAILICTARSLRKTDESMATPSWVNTNGGRRSPMFADGLEVTTCDLQCPNSALEG
jgi:hypothetical protein